MNVPIFKPYSKCSKTFLSLFTNQMLVSRALFRKKLVRIANREDADLTASSEAVRSGSALWEVN